MHLIKMKNEIIYATEQIEITILDAVGTCHEPPATTQNIIILLICWRPNDACESVKIIWFSNSIEAEVNDNNDDDE